MMIRALLTLPLLLALTLLAAIPTTGAQADDNEQTVQIIAQLRDDGRIEFGLRTAAGNQFPPRRMFPAGDRETGWLRSSPIPLANGAELRIIAQRLADGRVEFGLRIDEPRQEFLPARRYFPPTAAVGGWLTSSSIPIAPPPTESAEHAADIETISGGHRDGLIVNRGVLGDPDAPALIVEYGDPF